MKIRLEKPAVNISNLTGGQNEKVRRRALHEKLYSLLLFTNYENIYSEILLFHNTDSNGYLYFPAPGPWPLALVPNLCLPALAPNLYLPVLAPNLYLPALVPNLYLPALVPNLYLPALAPNLYLPALTPNLCLPALAPIFI